MMTMTTYFATAAKGLETLLAEELTDMGMAEVKEARAGVYFSGGIEEAYRACLWSRVANRILLPLGQYPSPTPEALYDGVSSIDWSQHMSVMDSFAVDASVSNSAMTHSQYAALKTKDAVVDQFRTATGERPSVETEKPSIQVNVYINNDEAQIYLDLSGESLHLRGYRTRGSAAPLKETLAAAILYRAKWPTTFKEGGAFVDFMCGSGTLPIEAAMMACDIAPGIRRSYFGFLGWKQHHSAVWERLMNEAAERGRKGLENAPLIRGFDHHEGTLERANQHIRQAQLTDVVTIVHQDLFTFEAEIPSKGLVAINPPYGKRMGQDEDLDKLYRQIGTVLKTQFAGWKAAVFTDDKSKGKVVGIRAHKIHSLFNGALPCKLLHFNVEENEFFHDYRLPRPIPAEERSEQSKGFMNRLQKNLKQMSRWSKKESIDCYRLYDADLPDYSVAIDVYEGEKRWVHVQEYEAPKTIEEEKAKLRLREIISIIPEVLNVTLDEIFLKARRRQKGDSQYEKLGEQKNFHKVREGQCQFLVNFEDYLDTGLFLDHRPIRLKVASESQGKSVLNLFAYTGAVTVHAVQGGATRTVTVDMSKTYLEWAERNMHLNHLLQGDKARKHTFVQADCIKWLAQGGQVEKFDIVFVDPPSFSNSKRMADVFDVQRDHANTLRQSMRFLARDGVLYFSNNLRGFKLDADLLDEFIVTDITVESVPFDFRQRKHIHRCWELRHPSVWASRERDQDG
jgi:23S rRNA (guanine2445-N2)-methyltransferase / 23S rRNA (guanine2069-N7)-methyltransferase